MIKLFLIDDHEVLRKGLGAVLKATGKFKLLGTVSTGEMALDVLSHMSEVPDVILIDIRMPGMNGIETMQKLTHQLPNTKFIALTAATDPSIANHFLSLGGKGYIAKGADTDVITQAIQLVYSGQSYVTPF